MNVSVVLVLALAGGISQIDPSSRNDKAAIQGIWYGTGLDERYTLIFCGDVLIGMVGNHPLVGTKQSSFRLHDGSIDIDREEGLQLAAR